MSNTLLSFESFKNFSSDKIQNTDCKIIYSKFFAQVNDFTKNLIIFAGSPGCGKTTFRKSHYRNPPYDKYLVIDMDEVALSMHQYTSMLESGKPLKECFQAIIEPAQEICHIMFRYAIERDISILYDRTCSFIGSLEDIRYAMNNHTYTIKMLAFFLPEDEIKKRLKKRNEEGNRFMDLDLATQCRTNFNNMFVSEYLPRLQTIEAKSDNSTIFTKESNNIIIKDQTLFDQLKDPMELINTSSYNVTNIESTPLNDETPKVEK